MFLSLFFMKPLLSIIIPFYGNASKQRLDLCIDSIRAQHMAEGSYEIIVADDEGRGPGGARNIGMSRAKGTYILFVDADDVLFTDTLHVCLALVRQHQPDMLSFGFRETHSYMSVVVPSVINNTSLYVSGAEYMLNHNFLGTVWRHLFHREWLEDSELQFAENIYHEDEAFVAKAYYKAGKTIVTDWVVYNYVHREGSLLATFTLTECRKRISDFRAVLSDLKSFINQLYRPPKLQRRAIQRRLSFLTIDYLVQLKRNNCTLAEWRKAIKSLRREGLLPLHTENYSSKYMLARWIINPISRLF